MSDLGSPSERAEREWLEGLRYEDKFPEDEEIAMENTACRPDPPATVDVLATAVRWLERDTEIVMREHRRRHAAGGGVAGSLGELCNYLRAAHRRASEEG